MYKKNCWQIKRCGRYPGGLKVKKLGACPAAMDVLSDGLNSGINGGRICWAIAGTFCGGKKQGTFAQKTVTCMVCDVFQQIRKEESSKFVFLKRGQKYNRRK